MIAKNMLKPVSRPLAPARNDDTFPGFSKARNMATENLKNVYAFLRTFRRKAPALPATEIDACAFRHTERRKCTHAPFVRKRLPFIARQIECFGRQRLVARRIRRELCVPRRLSCFRPRTS